MNPSTRSGSANRREEIIVAAVDLFRRRGYEATSMRELAETVGVRKATLYHHFGSKRELLVTIHERFMEALFERADLRDRSGDPVDLLRGYIHDLLSMIRDLRPYVEVFFRERYALSGPEWEQVRERRRLYESYVKDAVQRGIESGQFRADLDASIVSFGIFGICNWTYQWFDPDGRLSADQIAEVFSNLVLGGLQADVRRAASPSAWGPAR